MSQLNRKELIELSTEALGTLFRYGVIQALPDTTRVIEELDSWLALDFAPPLLILSWDELALPRFDVEFFSDCIEGGYYQQQLERLASSSNGRIEFTQIEEHWGEQELELRFKFNGEPRKLDLEHERPDEASPAFLEFLHHVLSSTIQGWTYVAGNAHEDASMYHPVPVSAAEELNTLEDRYTKKT